jgi:hypothetical protein
MDSAARPGPSSSTACSTAEEYTRSGECPSADTLVASDALRAILPVSMGFLQQKEG